MTQSSEEYTPEEVLDWLCWMWAQDGERFYSFECSEKDDDRLNKAIKLNEARSKFRDIEMWGFDPVETAAREHRDLMERENDVTPMDWSWWYDK